MRDHYHIAAFFNYLIYVTTVLESIFRVQQGSQRKRSFPDGYKTIVMHTFIVQPYLGYIVCSMEKLDE